jgi:predicted RNA-binding Zn-ribbon protein involved in translation (DUF1610 family)
VLLPVVGIVSNPSSQVLVLLLPFGTGLAFVFLLIFYNTFYLTEKSKPSFLERIRVWKCPYCGERRGRMVDRVLVGGEQGGSTDSGSRGAGIYDVKNLTYKEGFLCSNCGNTWSKTIVHEMRAYPVSHQDDSAPELKDDADSPRDSPWD